jgi:hypothetical protein
MYTAWLTLVCIVGVGQPDVVSGPDVPAATPQCCPLPPQDPPETCFKLWTAWLPDWFRPMPQTCYTPRYGCYPGNGRDIHRYPAFHGNYYRKPYNYRNLFEWPWLAEPHEPARFCVTPCAAEMAMPSAGLSPVPFPEELPVPRVSESPLPSPPAKP